MPSVATTALSAASVTHVIDDLCATGQATGDAGEIIDIGSFAITPAAGALLESAVRAIADEHEPATYPAGLCIIEVGCASALSTLHICRGMLAAQNGHGVSGCVHVIDPRQTTHWKNIGRRSILRAELNEHVHFHELAAHEALPNMIRQLDHVHFAFIDGWHMLDYIMVEAFYIDFMLDVGGIIAIHDLWMPGLQQFASFWVTNRGYEPVSVTETNGISRDPAHAINQVAGDLTKATPHFREHLAPFVDESMLFLRKTREDRRTWDAFNDFISA